MNPAIKQFVTRDPQPCLMTLLRKLKHRRRFRNWRKTPTAVHQRSKVNEYLKLPRTQVADNRHHAQFREETYSRYRSPRCDSHRSPVRDQYRYQPRRDKDHHHGKNSPWPRSPSPHSARPNTSGSACNIAIKQVTPGDHAKHVEESAPHLLLVKHSNLCVFLEVNRAILSLHADLQNILMGITNIMLCSAGNLTMFPFVGQHLEMSTPILAVVTSLHKNVQVNGNFYRVRDRHSLSYHPLTQGSAGVFHLMMKSAFALTHTWPN